MTKLSTKKEKKDTASLVGGLWRGRGCPKTVSGRHIFEERVVSLKRGMVWVTRCYACGLVKDI